MRPFVHLIAAWSLLISCFAGASYGQNKSVDELSVESIRHPEQLQLSLWADSTQLANPVAFTIDNSGVMFICETFRQNQGVEDNRSHMDWLDDDLAAQSLDDRLAYFKKHLGDDVKQYEEQEDRITRLVDTNRDGKADQYGVFADGFNDILAGTGAGVLVHNGEVFYTCIPDVWKLIDNDNDGVADDQTSLHYGYGVRVAFRGHDLHGLVIGPDGRLYFSIGDRGYNITTKDGRTLHDPASGAVFRCELDGSKLEVFATGLRNPQELAFDDHGNLFTGDNNSDGGDQARLVHVVEGGDTGWRMYYQYLSDRGPWNREKLWHPQHDGQAAYLVPPICNFADGPSGLTYYPGTGLGKQYKNTFFLCDFRGDAAISGVRSFRFEPAGATYKMVQPERFLWNVLATDVDFGPDGAMYLTDWIEGWNGVNRGRVIRVSHPDEDGSKRAKNIARLLEKTFAAEKVGSLARRMGHADRRIRMKSQFEIVRRGAVWQLAKVAKENGNTLARLHAVWGLGQLARTTEISKKESRAVQSLLPLTQDDAHVIRKAAIEILGDLRTRDALPNIKKALADAHPAVRAAAGIAISKFGLVDVTTEVVELLAKNDDADTVLRHGGIVALANNCTIDQLLALRDDERTAVRRAVVVALRRKKSARVAEFLRDKDRSIVAEAALAIHDVPIVDAMPELAALASTALGDDDALIRRVLNANFRLGGEENARAITQILGETGVSESMQLEALAMLESWNTPSNRDRVLGDWRPLSARSREIAANALQHALPRIANCPPTVAIEGIRLATTMGLKEAGAMALQMVTRVDFDAPKRAALLRPLTELLPDMAKTVVAQALDDTQPNVRAAARDLLVELDPESGMEALASAMTTATVMEQQAAFATLATVESDQAADILQSVAKKQLLTGKLAPEVQLDAVEAVKRRGLEGTIESFLGDVKNRPYGEAHLAVVGGDVDRGKAIFEGNVTLSCTRCHKAGKDGGRVGPNLAGIGATKTPDYLLESLVDPNKVIAEGFGTLIVVTEDGLQKQGVLQKETDAFVQLVDAEGKQFFVMKDEILDRTNGKSAMPEDLTKDLTPFELRDLIAFLQSLKTPWVETVGHD